jgi:hypothetical protein
MNRPLMLVLLATALLTASARCQAQPVQQDLSAKPSAPPVKVDPVIEKKALDLLDSLTDQVMNLHAPSNRMRAEIAVGDLLWSRDEKRARALFTAALAQLTSRISELDYSDQEVYAEITRITQSRQELLMRIAAHDPELAITALRQTRLPDNNARARGGWSFQNEANLELGLANLIAAKDPAAALKLARSSLSRGVSWNVISFLSQLYQKDAAAAQSLYQEIVGKIKDDNMARSPDLANNAWNLLTSFQPPQADEDTYRDLLNTTLGYVLGGNHETQTGMTMAQNFYYQLERMKPLVEKYAPARAAELRDWSRTVERTLDPQVKMYQDLRKISENGTVDDMLALAAKYPPEFQNLLYQNAAWKALTGGDANRAKEIIDMMPDPVQRRQMLDQIENQTANALEGNNKIIEARRLADKAKTIDRKIDILIRMAGEVAASGDKKGGLDLLNEAKAIVASTPQSAGQLNAQLRLAQAYLKADPDQSFALLQPLVTKVNELVAAAALLDGIDFRYLSDGEWQMPGASNLGNLVNSLDQTVAALGQTDFDRARTLADQIERPEMRVLMEIDMAQTALGIKPINAPPFGGRIMSGGLMIINQ